MKNMLSSPPMIEAQDCAYSLLAPFHPLQDEGVFNSAYQPLPGLLTQDKVKPLKGGSVLIGSYLTDRASHRVGLYVPSGYDQADELPKVLMTTPLATGVRGHNQVVAEEMMRSGFVVIKKGVPRYPGFTTRALTLTEDANEMLGLVKQVDKIDGVSPTNELFVYGESQAAMKALGVLGLASAYNLDVVDALVVAACFFKKVNLARPDRQAKRMVDMVTSAVRFAHQSTPDQRQRLKGTFSIKDLHHHLAVIPVLLSGETGEFLPHIPTQQVFSKELYGKDGNSHPYQVRDELVSLFPNVSARILHEYGHLDGITSNKTAALRGAMLLELARRYDNVAAA